jgi:ankyrin repeat protein
MQYFYKLVNYLKVADRNHLTALHIACKYSHEKSVLVLLGHLSTDQIMDLSPPNPLHIMVKNKHVQLEVVRAFLEKFKAKNQLDKIVYVEDNSGQTVLHLALIKKHFDLLEMLVKDYAQSDLRERKNGYFLVHLAAKANSVEFYAMLKKYNNFKCDVVNFENKNLIHLAAENRAVNFLRAFLNQENRSTSLRLLESVDKSLNTPLFTAIINKNHKIVEEILRFCDLKADFAHRDVDANSIFHLCVRYNNLESLEYFLSNENLFSYNSFLDLLYSKNSLNETVVNVACRYGNLECLKCLLNKISANDFVSQDNLLFENQNTSGQTCLHVATSLGYYPIVFFLLKEKFLHHLIDFTDNSMNTCLHLAVENQHTNIVKLFLDYETIDLEFRNDQDLTAFQISLRKNFLEISKLFIEKYVKSSNTLNDDRNPLFIACEEGAHEIVKLLLEKGNFEKKDFD